MTRKDRFTLRLTTESKEYIYKKANDLGYGNVSAFLVDSAKTFFRLNVDMSVYRKLIREVNYIGKNINGIVRRINTEKMYSDLDVGMLEDRLEEIFELLNKEYSRLGKLSFEFMSDDLTEDITERLIKSFEANKLPVPKHLILEDTYQKIHDSLVLITDMIKHSSYQDEDVEDYVWDYLYGRTLTGLPEDKLIAFSNQLYGFFEVMKIKSINLDYEFTDEDWIDLVDILNEFEIE